MYEYDHAGRLLKTKHKLDTNEEVTLVENTYDDLGRIKSSKRHGNSALATDYTYNVRSWIKTLTTDTLFTQTLHYNDSYGGSTPCYNGNISGMSWKAAGDTGVHGYRFSYDGLSRLTAAGYLWNGTPSPNYSTSYTYNRQSNLTSLRRNGRTGASSYGLIDDLTFTLDGNWLTRVDDAATASAYNNGFEFKDAVKQGNEYTYDKNGNMTKDLNKNITDIQYNCLNSPCKVTFKDGSTITYTYALNGAKLRTVHKTGNTTSTTDYCGNVIYENGVQKLLLTDAGHVTLSDKKYHYYLQDHQGNNRVVVDQAGQKEEVNHYYPFGGTFASAEKSIQPYKYNGKELDTKNGLNWYDYGARYYDVAIGRWNAVDPLAEKYYGISPYAYCVNNPISLIDPDGKAAQIPPFFLGTANPLVTMGSRMTMLGTADKVVKALPKEEHHIIPRSLGKHDVVKAAREGGFKLEGKENKMTVDKFSKATGEGQHGKHPKYTEQLRKEFNEYLKENPKASPEESANFVRGQVSNARNAIENNPNTKVNDLELKSLTLPTDGIKVIKPVELIRPVKAINPWDA